VVDRVKRLLHALGIHRWCRPRAFFLLAWGTNRREIDRYIRSTGMGVETALNPDGGRVWAWHE
jgi:hypothetical protein